MTKKEALALYNKHTFIENILLLKNRKLASIFIDYSFLLKMTDDKSFLITVDNLKVLLEVANIDINLEDIDTRYAFDKS